LEKVSDEVLAQTNVSVTGASVKDQIVGVEKGVVNPETLHYSEPVNNCAGFFPSISKVMETIGLNLNINGQTTFWFYAGGMT